MYITEGDLENLILQDIDSSYSSFISVIIDAVEQYIDDYCGTDFVNLTAQTKYFDGSGTDEIYVGDYQAGTLTAIEVLDMTGSVIHTLTLNADFYEYPLNDTYKNTLVLVKGGQISRFPSWNRAIKITGTFGRTAPPSPVKMAAIKLAAKILNEGLRGGQIRAETLGSYSVDYIEIDEKADTMGIKNILDMYAETRIGTE